MVSGWTGIAVEQADLGWAVMAMAYLTNFTVFQLQFAPVWQLVRVTDALLWIGMDKFHAGDKQ